MTEQASVFSMCLALGTNAAHTFQQTHMTLAIWETTCDALHNIHSSHGLDEVVQFAIDAVDVPKKGARCLQHIVGAVHIQIDPAVWCPTIIQIVAVEQMLEFVPQASSNTPANTIGRILCCVRAGMQTK